MGVCLSYVYDTATANSSVSLVFLEILYLGHIPKRTFSHN